MIKNEREYRITTAQANKHERALSQLDTPQAPTGLHPLIQKAQRDALQSQLDELREQIAEYESLKSGQQAAISLNSLEEIPAGAHPGSHRSGFEPTRAGGEEG